jgi:uncharacterized protein (TIRG00374 family)
LALPLLISGRADDNLLAPAVTSLVVFVALAALAVLMVAADRPLRAVATAIERARNRLRRHSPHTHHLADRVQRERDGIVGALGDDWPKALLATVGRWAFDYAILLASLAAVGAHPLPALVLLAFCLAQVLAQIPVTPGGLGFVETGLTALLALAGVGAGDAVLATFLYRLFTYWVPLPLGLVGLALHRRHGGPGDTST